MPVSSRIEASEAKLRFEFKKRIRESFSKYLPPEINWSVYFVDVQIPHVSYYSYGHEIAVLSESKVDRLSISHVYQALAGYLLELTNQGTVQGV